jgi:hypothetical protein
MTAHNQWLSTTRFVPYWTASVFSSAVTNDERRITAYTSNSFWLGLRMNHDSFNFQVARRESTTSNSCYTVCCHGNLCLATCCLATIRSLLFVAARTWLTSRCSVIDVSSGSTTPTFRRCLPSRCLVMDYSVTICYLEEIQSLKWLNVGQRFAVFCPVCLLWPPTCMSWEKRQ